MKMLSKEAYCIMQQSYRRSLSVEELDQLRCLEEKIESLVSRETELSSLQQTVQTESKSRSPSNFEDFEPLELVDMLRNHFDYIEDHELPDPRISQLNDIAGHESHQQILFAK